MAVEIPQSRSQADGQHGKHGGIVIPTQTGAVEINVFHSGMLPRFELFFYDRKGRVGR